MKKIISCLFILIFFINCAKKNENQINHNDSIISTGQTLTEDFAQIPETYYFEVQQLNKIFTNRSDSIDIRNFPDLNSANIGFLTHLDRINVLKEDERTVNIDGVDGNWIFIEQYNRQSWVFNGNLNITPLNIQELNMVKLTENKMEDIINHIRDYFNLNNIHMFRDNTTLDDFLLNLGIGEGYRIIDKIPSPGINADIIYTYSIEYNNYKLTLWGIPDISRYLLREIEIKLDDSNFINLFPYMNFVEYYSDEIFGEYDFYGKDFIRYLEYFHTIGNITARDIFHQWILGFNENLLYSIIYRPYIP